MKKVLVLGANGQLGSCLMKIAPEYSNIQFVFLSSSQLDISDEIQVNKTFSKDDFDYCINCAAYTNVDRSEDERDLAFKVNAFGPKLLAKASAKFNTILIQISTDFVFDGSKTAPYNELDPTKPIGVYGESKLQGEQEIMKHTSRFFIVRTSWLYSEFGKNFVKTMINLSKKRTAISVVDDQIGAPTYALDLAMVLLRITDSESENYGIYHFSNKGEISWFDFASKVFELKGIVIDLTAIKTKEYFTKAERPLYSVLDTTKIEGTFKIIIGNWEDRLKEALKDIHD